MKMKSNKRNVFVPLLFSAALLAAGCGVQAKDYTKKLKLGEYKGLTVDRIVTTITDEDVEYAMTEEIESYSEYLEVTDRAAQIGDMVTVDFVGYMDGEEIEGGSEEDCEVTIGAGEFIDGFEEGIIGMTIGETKDIICTFPEEYDGELDGKEATFKMTLKSILEIQRPEFNDDFVKEISDYSSVEEYKAATKDQLQKDADADASYMAAYEALSLVVDNSVLKDYPKELVAEAMEQMEADAQAFAEQFGINVEDLYGEDYNPEDEAKNQVKEKLVVQSIAKKENISVTEEEYQDYVGEISLMYGYETQEQFEEENSKDDIMYQLLYEKVVQFLSENTTFNDVSEEEYYGSESDFGDELTFGDLEDYPELNDVMDSEIFDGSDFFEGEDEND